jgi:glycosyltransferase involved in cell wall biosynthesis
MARPELEARFSQQGAMKVILAHNYYGSSAPSGENAVFEAEAQLLRQRGHTVIELTRRSDEIRGQRAWGSIKGGLSTPWNPFSKRVAEKMISRERPDVFHVHNSFPLLSPSVFYAAQNSRTATVLTLHNFRTYCAAGIPMRGERPCTDCLDRRSVVWALLHRCYRGSLAATAPMAAMIWLHRCLGTWQSKVDAFIALTEFQKDILCAAGLPRERVFVKPHFLADPPEPLPWNVREAKVLFIGRLGAEKGCHILLEAWRRWGSEAPRLEVIGEGPERSKLEALVNEAGLNDRIAFPGQLSFEKVQESLGKARLLVLPSLCFEGLPMVIQEAYALGVPVAASRLGSMPCLIIEGITGTLFEAGNPNDLLEKVKNAWGETRRLAAWGEGARKEFDATFTADTNYRLLMQIYREAIGNRMKKIQG